MLRDKAGPSQRELAEKLGTTIETVSRWENRRRAPTREALKKLADLAGDVGLKGLQDFFEAERAASLAATIKNLPSAGTQRGVSLADLERWCGMAQHIREQVREAREAYIKITANDPRLGPTHRQMWSIADDLIPQLMKSIEVYISGPKKKEKRSGKN